MLYLNDRNIRELECDWKELINTIEQAVFALMDEETSQPIKLYLRYKNKSNRLISMPAYVGGEINACGLKWISSFPGNPEKGISRANCVSILNDPDTGVPISIINTPHISTVRTAAISGLVYKNFVRNRCSQKLHIGIIGFGPIGQEHARMLFSLFGDTIAQVHVYDLKGVVSHDLDQRIVIHSNWNDVYNISDVLITTTVSKERYIEGPPKKGALLLNISLRDYKDDIYNYVQNSIIVDSWAEVCREDTDVERMHLSHGLQKSDSYNLLQVVKDGVLDTFPVDVPIMFNPMGMASFDVAIAKYYYLKALEENIGITIE